MCNAARTDALRPKVRCGLAVLWLLGASAPALALDGPRRARADGTPRHGETEVVITDEGEGGAEAKELAPALKAVIFLTLQDGLLEQTEGLEGIRTEKVPVLGTPQFREALAQHLGKPLSASSLRAMARAAVEYHRAQGRPGVEVVFPEQDAASGIVQLVVVDAHVGQVSIAGHRWFSDSVMRQVLTASPGDALTDASLRRQLRRANRNQFRSVKALLKPGAAAGTTDLVFQAEDRFPVRFRAGYDDTGSAESGYTRILEGFTWGNAFMQGHELSYDHIQGLDYNHYAEHSAAYRAPLPWDGHDLTASGSYSVERWDLRPGRDFDLFWQYGLRYGVQLPRSGSYTHRLEGGFDHKRRDYDADGGGKFVRDIVQFQLQYEGELKDERGSTSFCVIGVASPGGLTKRNTSRNLDRERTAVGARYAYVYLSFERLWDLPAGVTLQNRVMAQVASARLSYAEQLGFGGFQTVRGYDESKIGTDQGLLVSVELRSPAFVLGSFGADERFEHRLQGLAFFDSGFGDTKSRRQDEERSEKLESAGLGIRYNMGQHITLRLDYAWRLKDLEDDPNETGRAHLGVTVSY